MMLPCSAEPLILRTIYDRPRDYPEHVVVRTWLVHGGGHARAVVPARLFNTVDEARAAMPPGAVRVPRDPSDDPVIVETWL